MRASRYSPGCALSLPSGTDRLTGTRGFIHTLTIADSDAAGGLMVLLGVKLWYTSYYCW